MGWAPPMRTVVSVVTSAMFEVQDVILVHCAKGPHGWLPAGLGGF